MAKRGSDVFLSHNGLYDKPVVERIADALKRLGIEPWLDAWSLTPGGAWQQECLEGLRQSRACAVFVGPHGVGPWESEEAAVAVDRGAKDRGFRVFPVLLPGLPDPFDISMLPPFLSSRTWVDMRGGLGRVSIQRLIAAIQGNPWTPATMVSATDVCPYVGLLAFDEHTTDFFFGRDHDIQRLLEKAKAERFLALVGASGSGKSSLLRAGLLPRLRIGAVPGSETWNIRVFTPGPRPLTALAAQLTDAYPDAPMHRTLDDLGSDARTLHLAASLGIAREPSGGRLVLAIDQFEEIFTLCQDSAERQRFVANLVYAASVSGGPCTAFVALRADFYGACAAYPDLAAEMSSGQFLVGPLGRPDLIEAVERPAHLVGLDLEHGLVDTIVDQVVGQPGGLPLLEHAMRELWGRRRGYVLTLEAYREAGGVEGALAKRAEEIYAAFDPEEQTTARRVLLRLTQPGDGTEATRRRASMAELITDPSVAEPVERVVDALAEARLLTVSSDDPTGSPSISSGALLDQDNPAVTDRWVDVAHEALIRGWPRLRAWVDQDRVGLRTHRRMTEGSQEWQRLGLDPAQLYRGTRLAEALEWRRDNEASLNPLERRFIDASVEHQAREREAALAAARKEAAVQRTAANRLRGIAIVLLIGLVASGTTTWKAFQQGNLARQQSSQADARNFAAQARAIQSIDPTRAFLLAHTAVSIASSDQTQYALRRALAGALLRRAIGGPGNHVVGTGFDTAGNIVTITTEGTADRWDPSTWRRTQIVAPTNAQFPPVSATIGPQGHAALVQRADGSIELWNLGSVPGSVQKLHIAGPTVSVSFDREERHVLVVSALAGAWVVDVHNPTAPVRLDAPTTSLTAGALAPDGEQAVVGGGDGTVLLCDAVSRRCADRQGGPPAAVLAAAFSPLHPQMVTANADGTAWLWTLGASPPAPPTSIAKHGDFVRSVAFSPDGSSVLLTSDDHTAELVRLDTPGSLTLVGHLDRVGLGAFSTDGRFAITASADGSVRVWETQTGFPVATLSTRGGPVLGATMGGPDDREVLTLSSDGVVRQWSVEVNRIELLREHTGAVLGAAFDSDGRTIVTIGADAAATAWDALTGRRLEPGVKGPSQILAVRPDGCRLAVTTTDRVDPNDRRRCPNVFPNLPPHSQLAAFSADGSHLVDVSPPETATGSQTVTVWDPNTSRGQVLAKAFSVDAIALDRTGSLAAFGGANGIVTVMRVDPPGPVASIPNEHPVQSLAFDADGHSLAVAAGSTTTIYEVPSGRFMNALPSRHGPVLSVAFGSDSAGPLLATGNEDGTVAVWDLEKRTPVIVLSGHSQSISAVSFGTDGRETDPSTYLVTAGNDGIALLYPWALFARWPLVHAEAAHLYRALTPSVPRPSQPPAPSPGSVKETVPIGLLTDLTGPTKSFGSAIQAAVQLAVEQVNRAGGINGSPVRVIVEDTSGNAQQAKEQLLTLVNQKHVFAVLGPLSSTSATELFPTAQDLGVPIVTGSANLDGLPGMGDWAFRDTATNAQLYGVTLPVYRDTFSVRRVAIVLDDGQPGVTTALPEFKRAAKTWDVTVVGKPIHIPPQQNRLGGVAGKIESRVNGGHIDGLVVLSGPVEAGLLARAMAKAGVALPVLGHPAQDSAAFFDVGGVAISRWLLPSVFSEYEQGPAAVRFAQALRRAGVSRVVPEAANYYDMLNAIVRLARAAGIDVTTAPKEARERIALRLRSLSYEGAGGTTRFCPSGNTEKTVYSLLAQSGSSFPVPEAAKVAPCA